MYTHTQSQLEIINARQIEHIFNRMNKWCTFKAHQNPTALNRIALLENSCSASRITVSEAKCVSFHLQFYNEIQSNMKEWHICFLKDIPQACPKPGWLPLCAIVVHFVNITWVFLYPIINPQIPNDLPNLPHCTCCLISWKTQFLYGKKSLQQRSPKHHLHKGKMLPLSILSSFWLWAACCLLCILFSARLNGV